MTEDQKNESLMRDAAAAAAAITSGPPRFTRAQIKTLVAGFPQYEWRSAAQRAEDLGCSVESLLALEAATRDPRAHDGGTSFDPRTQTQSFGVRR